MPNPNKGTFTVKGTLPMAEDQDVTIEITDMLGQVVYKKSVPARKGELNEEVTLGNKLANGMYILNAHTETSQYMFHFVIEE